MRNLAIVPLLLTLLAGPLSAQVDLPENARSMLIEGIRLIDAGEHDEAWDLLERAGEKYPAFSVFRYEQGYILFMQERYDEALKVYEEIIDADDADYMYYKMLGNSYDLTGDPEKAIETYNEGLERYPNAGPLYLEMGVMHLKEEDYESAILTWEKGLTVDPKHSSNYFHVARLFLPTEVRGWGIIYGEIFLNLEPNSPRSHHIRELLWDAWQSSVTRTEEDVEDGQGGEESNFSFSFSFWSDAMSIYSTDSGMMAGFPYFFEMNAIGPTLTTSLGIDGMKTIESIRRFREAFIRVWFDEENREAAEFFDVTLLDYQRRLIDAGHFEAYNIFLFYNEENREEVESWMEEHPNGMSDMAAWMEKNPYPIETNPFSRLTLDMMPAVPVGMHGLGSDAVDIEEEELEE